MTKQWKFTSTNARKQFFKVHFFFSFLLIKVKCKIQQWKKKSFSAAKASQNEKSWEKCKRVKKAERMEWMNERNEFIWNGKRRKQNWMLWTKDGSSWINFGIHCCANLLFIATLSDFGCVWESEYFYFGFLHSNCVFVYFHLDWNAILRVFI